ncbi:protein kinase domain-containing protein [Trebonia kvetii]|nr:protein kinase [Trebonia kvetii]
MAVTGSRVLGGRYVLAEVLGTGGMATVWRAHDQVLGREVAVKVLSQQFAADPGFADRFEREARHAASVSHPRLVTVFDSGIDRGTPFLVMELVTGRTLRQVLDDAGPLPAGQAVAIAAGVCEGLEAAHAAGLVHRDIKPVNIMLAGGEVKILDFGIARADGTAARTATGTVLGTPAYLSPEQAAGHPAGPASDLYSLGCVLFEMLTGSPPFTAESQLALAYRQVYDDPGPPSARRPGLPASLDQLTARLLAKAPAARPASAAAARAGPLAVPAQGGTALPPATPARTQGSRQRLRRPETLLTAALTAALAALVAVLLAGPGSTRPAGPAPAAAGTTARTHAATRPATPTRTHAATRPAASTPAPAATRPAASTRAPVSRPPESAAPTRTPAQTATAPALPPTATAAAALVGNLQAGVADGQVTQQAGQDLFSHLQPLLFGPPGPGAQQTQKQFTQLVQAYDKHQSQGQITGKAATTVPKAIAALGAALGVH